jgi:hypothetical protein
MKIDWENYLIQTAISAVVILSFILILGCLSSCAWSSQTRMQTNDKSRIQGTAGGLPVDVTVERQIEAQEQTAGETRSPALAAMASSVVEGGMSGGPIGGLIGLALGAFTAWKAASGTIKKLEADSTEGWQEAKRHQERAEQYALKLPPSNGAA